MHNAPYIINSRGRTVLCYEKGVERVTASIVTTPNLPKGEVEIAISAIPISGITCITPPAVDVLPLSMQRHADLQLCHLGDEYIVAAPEVYSYYEKHLSPLGFKILRGESTLSSTYPGDAAYNIARVGNLAFLNPSHTDPVALRFFREKGIKIIPIRQGYSKCCVVPIDERALITADRGIVGAARSAGLDVLEIQPGGVELAGFSYGFLGGATGKIGTDILYVTGQLAHHPSQKEIYVFLQKKGIKIQERSIPIPIDIGSVLPLMTK